MAKSSASRINQAKSSAEPVTERFRGSSQVPLTPEGIAKAHELAKKLAKFGPFDEIFASDLDRTMRTAQIIARATHSRPPKATPALHPWHLGRFEGQPVTKAAIDYLNHLAHDEPDKKLTGRGPKSTADGESFNDFVKRAGTFFYEQAAKLRKDPDLRIFIETHYRDLLLFQALADEGMPKDFKHEAGRLFEQKKGNADIPPGTILRFYCDGDKLKFDHFEFDKREGGLYAGRHEATPWNKPSGTGAPS